MAAPVGNAQPLLERSQATQEEIVKETIKHARNRQYFKGRKGGCRSKFYETVLFKRILDPMLSHGSATIYAPDLTIEKLCGALCSTFARRRNSATSNNPGGGKNYLKRIGESVQEYWLYCILLVLAVAIFKKYGKALTCFFKVYFLGWAQINQSLDPWQRFLSISGMMALRMVVSNILPFTSPAFAFLIAESQPVGEEYMGTFYLLACSMPAGFIVPFLDWLSYWVCYPCRSKELKQRDKDSTLFEEYDPNTYGAAQFDHHFHFTNFVSTFTDYLPFSFWVRRFFMQPAFTTIKSLSEGDDADVSACSGAVLAGHFMIWAGPATTMYQRQFVSDWWTCAFIQPLGLLEDVAVVLATWAGSEGHEQPAEMALYLFMIYMNLVSFLTVSISHHFKCCSKAFMQHLIVLSLTVSVLAARNEGVNFVGALLGHPSSTTQTTTLVVTEAKDVCGPAVHSNTKTAAVLLAWVTFLAIIMRIVARLLTCDLPCCEQRVAQEKSNKPKADRVVIAARVLILLMTVVFLLSVAFIGGGGLG